MMMMMILMMIIWWVMVPGQMERKILLMIVTLPTPMTCSSDGLIIFSYPPLLYILLTWNRVKMLPRSKIPSHRHVLSIFHPTIYSVVFKMRLEIDESSWSWDFGVGWSEERSGQPMVVNPSNSSFLNSKITALFIWSQRNQIHQLGRLVVVSKQSPVDWAPLQQTVIHRT